MTVTIHDLRTQKRKINSLIRQAEALAKSDPYDAHREAARLRHAIHAAASQEISPLPEIADEARRNASLASFSLFCKTYFAEIFKLPWSPSHFKAIDKIERAVIHGDLFALAMPRASGKTALTLAACLWAILTGRRRFVCLIAAKAGMAKRSLEKIKTWSESNELLLADFPETFYPIRRLERITQRQKGQKYNGEPTRMSWLSERIVFPTIKDSLSSGAIISTTGMKGGDIRGQNHTILEDGESKLIRPDLVIVDDPQTRDIARNPEQCSLYEEIVAADILGMAGPGKKIAGVMCCTIICQGDLSARILDRSTHPEWSGETTKLVHSFPTDMKLWEEYWDLRMDLKRNDLSLQPSTDFYDKRREKMDDGFVSSWPERFNEDEISAAQYAMNLMFKDRRAFFSEYQNDPLLLDEEETQITAAEIAARVNGHNRGVVPVGGNHLTAFIDVQGACLFYVVAAWRDDFTGYVIDYGAYPDQKKQYFSINDVRYPLQSESAAAGLEGAIYAGLDKLTKVIIGREWMRDDGAAMRIERCLIDANWGNSTAVVKQFCRQSQFANVLMPSHGRYVGASSRPLNDYHKKPGDRVGLHWRVTRPEGREVRHVLFDTNSWKSFVHRRLALAMGDRGSLSLFGTNPETHRMFADHLTAEYAVRVGRLGEADKGREVDEWKLRAGRPDNHWFDCIVGCAVAASMQGCDLLSPGNAAGVHKVQGPRPTARQLLERGRR